MFRPGNIQKREGWHERERDSPTKKKKLWNVNDERRKHVDCFAWLGLADYGRELLW